MEASMTTGFSARHTEATASAGPVLSNRRRHLSPRAGHAIEILGHAIEYLTDEFANRGAQILPGNGEWEAVQLLMALNRQVYFECPVELTVVDRLRSAFHLRAA